MSTTNSPTTTTDRGSILPLVLVIVVILGVVVAATANYAATTLRFGQVVEQRADRMAAAQAATNDAIEQLKLQRPLSLCATALGAGSGTNYTFPEIINESSVEVNCRLVNGSIPGNDGIALAITGEGMNAGVPTLDLDNGGRPEIKGPVFVHDPSRVELKQTTTLFEGDLIYQDTAATVALESSADPCDIDPSTTQPVEFDRVVFSPPIDKLEFDPPGLRGMYCINRTWDQIFSAPQTDPALAGLGTPPAFDDATYPGCRVFGPGHYTTAPALDRNNYFTTGVYHFDGIGLLSFNNKEVATFGNSNAIGWPAISNSPCDAARTADSTDGATLYISGDTQFHLVDNPSGIDVSGRLIGGTRVALHVLNTTLDPNTDGLLTSNNGNGREAAFHGQFWAPESSLLFLTIPSKKSAILRGGAIVAALRGKVSAAGTDGFLIEVATTESDGDLQIEAVADNGQGTTTVRTIIDYRPSNGDAAIRSRRVIW